jgi:hypothetical protein
MHMPLALTVAAWVFDDPAFTAAAMTGAFNSEKTLLGTNGPLSLTGTAYAGFGSGFCATSLAAVTGDGAGDGNLLAFSGEHIG